MTVPTTGICDVDVDVLLWVETRSLRPNDPRAVFDELLDPKRIQIFFSETVEK